MKYKSTIYARTNPLPEKNINPHYSHETYLNIAFCSTDMRHGRGKK